MWSVVIIMEARRTGRHRIVRACRTAEIVGLVLRSCGSTRRMMRELLLFLLGNWISEIEYDFPHSLLFLPDTEIIFRFRLFVSIALQLVSAVAVAEIAGLRPTLPVAKSKRGHRWG